jgi:hypothetical protein
MPEVPILHKPQGHICMVESIIDTHNIIDTHQKYVESENNKEALGVKGKR